MLSSQDLKKLEQETELILRAAGRVIREKWHKIDFISYKNRRDVVSNVDIEVENTLRAKLKTLLPEAGFIVEEGNTEKAPLYNWVIDPIDGTKNYVNKFPLFMTQFALFQNDEPILGQIYNPISDQFFSASLGNGTYLNGKKIESVSKRDPEAAIVDVDFGGVDEELQFKLKTLNELIKKFFRVRIFGGIVTAYLATGAFDAYIALSKKVKIVDYAPNVIILREAGLITNYINVHKNKRVLVSSQKRLFELITDILVNITYE